MIKMMNLVLIGFFLSISACNFVILDSTQPGDNKSNADPYFTGTWVISVLAIVTSPSNTNFQTNDLAVSNVTGFNFKDNAAVDILYFSPGNPVSTASNCMSYQYDSQKSILTFTYTLGYPLYFTNSIETNVYTGQYEIWSLGLKQPSLFQVTNIVDYYIVGFHNGNATNYIETNIMPFLYLEFTKI